MNRCHRKLVFRVFLIVLSFTLAGYQNFTQSQDFWSGNDPYTTGYSSSETTWGNERWLGSSGTDQEWRLGIEGANTQTGVVVKQVAPNSAAARAGINRMDVIVCVAGDQIGIVGGKVFDLKEELNDHADSRGGVELLIQDSRSGRLKALRVQLDDEQPGLTGTVVIPAGRLPANSVVTVQLTNTSRPQYVVRNGEYSFRPPAYSSGPIPFTLNFDPNYVFPNDTYEVRAYVTSAGRTVYDTRQPQYVLTRGNPKSVQLRLTPVSYGSYSGGVNANNGVLLTSGYANYDVVSQRVTSAYQRYLGRNPSAMELAAWHQVPDIDYRLSRLPLELMGSQEYFDRVGDNNLVWTRQVFGEIIGHTPAALELDQWMRRFADLRYSRTEVLNQMQSVADSR